MIESSIRQHLTGMDNSTSSPESSPGSGFLGMCARSGCPNPRINSDYAGPGQLSYYCCYDCLRIDMRNKRRRRKKRGTCRENHFKLGCHVFVLIIKCTAYKQRI